jgi:hypothetical protein
MQAVARMLVIVLSTLFTAITPALGATIAAEMDHSPLLDGFFLLGSSIPESAAYSVSGSVLHQDARGLSDTQSLAYAIEGIFDPTQSTVMEWRVKVIASTGIGRVEIHLITNQGIWEFTLTETEVRQSQPASTPIVSMNTRTGSIPTES